MSLKKFRRGERTYTCHCCKKLTRNTGGDEIHCQLCLDCYELGGINNYLSDNGDLGSYADEAREILTRRPELIPTEPDIAQALGLAVPAKDGGQ